MRIAIPPLREHVDDLKHRLQREHDGHKKPRLQMLHLLASGQARNRQEVASRLGVHRPPAVAGWPSMPPGGWTPCWPHTFLQANPSRSRRRCSPASSRRSAGHQALPRMKHCASGWHRPITCRSNTRRSTRSCARAFTLSSKCRAPVTQQNPEAMPAFQATCQAHLQQALPPDHLRPIWVCSQDESRSGLLTVRRRRLTAHGVQPIGPVHHVFEWFYV
jgi:hypothetical protein